MLICYSFKRKQFLSFAILFFRHRLVAIRRVEKGLGFSQQFCPLNILMFGSLAASNDVRHEMYFLPIQRSLKPEDRS